MAKILLTAAFDARSCRANSIMHRSSDSTPGGISLAALQTRSFYSDAILSKLITDIQLARVSSALSHMRETDCVLNRSLISDYAILPEELYIFFFRCTD